MARNVKTRKASRTKEAGRPARWWASFDGAARFRAVRRAAGITLAVALVVFAVVGFDRLDEHVRSRIEARLSTLENEADVRFLDLPDELVALATGDLAAAANGTLRSVDWTDDALCERIAVALSDLGWVEMVNFVRRTGPVRFDVSCNYRVPYAMVQFDGRFYLSDAGGVRLPGVYRYDPTYFLVQGVVSAPPPNGTLWGGADLQAGLTMIAALGDEPFAHQLPAVLVQNYGGRVDPHATHIELATDRQAGGRIRWGTAPGREVEENTIAQKIALLRANFRDTGRVDANRRVIDISTYPDRFTEPG